MILGYLRMWLRVSTQNIDSSSVRSNRNDTVIGQYKCILVFSLKIHKLLERLDVDSCLCHLGFKCVFFFFMQKQSLYIKMVLTSHRHWFKVSNEAMFCYSMALNNYWFFTVYRNKLLPTLIHGELVIIGKK
jgi:hypothetical protein